MGSYPVGRGEVVNAEKLADLANVLLIAGGAGLAVACAYLVQRPAPRTLRVWVGATLVAIPGLLLGLLLTRPELGVRAAYRGFTEAFVGAPQEVVATIAAPQPDDRGSAPVVEGPSLAPRAGGASPVEPTLPGLSDPAGTGSSNPPASPSSSPPPPPNSTSPTPTPSPSPTETTPPPSPTETSPPPSPTETSPPPSSEPPPPPPEPEPTTPASPTPGSTG